MMNHVLQNFSWESNAVMALLALTSLWDDYRTLETWIIQNTSFTEDSVHLAVQWCPLSQKFQLKKGEQVFFKRLQLLLFTGLSAET